MPFPIVWGIPYGTPNFVLVELRKNIVATLAETMPVKAGGIHVFFPDDMLGEPTDISEGSSTIYVQLDTAMFFDRSDTDELVKKVLEAITLVIFEAFDGKYEVEAFVGDLNPAWKYLIPRRGRRPNGPDRRTNS